MIAYDNQWLYNLYTRDQADEALDANCIDADTHAAIYSAAPVGFYTPNIWGRIGIALLTWLAITMGFSFFGLIFSLFDSPAVALIFAAVVLYGALEVVVVKQMLHHNSGSDNTLILLVAASFITGIGVATASGDGSHFLFVALCSAAICTYLAMRFADALMSILAALSVVIMIFLACNEIGAKAIAPFLIMGASFALYYTSAKLVRNDRWVLYRTCLNCISITALVTLYLAGNYYIADAASGNMGYDRYGSAYRMQNHVPLGWFFWLWTVLVPFAYIAAGIRSRNRILIRTGLVLISAAIFTYRHYYSLLSVDKALAIGGAVLALAGYALSRYLQTPKHGFTFEKETRINERETLHRALAEHVMSKTADDQRPQDGSW